MAQTKYICIKFDIRMKRIKSSFQLTFYWKPLFLLGLHMVKFSQQFLLKVFHLEGAAFPATFYSTISRPLFFKIK